MLALASAAFAAGLLGGVHCAGMCGGIVGSFSAAARGPALARQLAFNGGRIASYSLAGVIAGALGSLGQAADPLLYVQAALFALANVVMVMLGLYIAGWGETVLRFERAGAILWRRIEPYARSVFPIDSTAKSLGAGLLWGWVPCGLVYSILVLALASGSAPGGAAVMAAFGLGTLPALLAAGFFAQRLLALRRAPWVRRAAGTVIITVALVGLARVPGLTEALRAGWNCIA
jgi:hypothetical protein